MSRKEYEEAKDALGEHRGSGLRLARRRKLQEALFPEDLGIDEHLVHRRLQSVSFGTGQELYSCTETFTKNFCELIISGAKATTACEITGLPKRVFYTWLAKAEAGEEPYATFGKELIRALGMFELSIVQRMLRGEIPDRAAKWVLKNHNPDRWSDNPAQNRRDALEDVVGDGKSDGEDKGRGGNQVVVVQLPSNGRDREDEHDYIDVSS